MMLLSVILLIIFGISSSELLEISVSPKNPVGKINGRIHFRFKNVPKDYELIYIDGEFGGKIYEHIYRNSAPKTLNFGLMDGHVLYADIEEAIVFYLNTDFNNGRLTFKFYSKASKKEFSIISQKIRIVPEIDEFKFSADLKKNLYPFKSIPEVVPNIPYVIKLRKYENDKTPVNYIGRVMTSLNFGTATQLNKFSINTRSNEWLTKFGNVVLDYSAVNNILTFPRPQDLFRLFAMNILLIRKYNDIYQVHTTGTISLYKFYNSFHLNERTVNWKIRNPYTNGIDFYLFYYDGVFTSEYARGIVCLRNSYTCKILGNATQIFESATHESFTLKECPAVTKFVISFMVNTYIARIIGNTFEELINYTPTSSNCNIQNPVAEKIEDNSENSYENQTVDETSKSSCIQTTPNSHSFGGTMFGYKDQVDPEEYSNIAQSIYLPEYKDRDDIIKQRTQDRINKENQLSEENLILGFDNTDMNSEISQVREPSKSNTDDQTPNLSNGNELIGDVLHTVKESNVKQDSRNKNNLEDVHITAKISLNEKVGCIGTNECISGKKKTELETPLSQRLDQNTDDQKMLENVPKIESQLKSILTLQPIPEPKHVDVTTPTKTLNIKVNQQDRVHYTQNNQKEIDNIPSRIPTQNPKVGKSTAGTSTSTIVILAVIVIATLAGFVLYKKYKNN